MKNILLSAVIALTLVACGGGGVADTSDVTLPVTPTPTPTPTPSPNPVPVPVPSNYGSITISGSQGANEFTPCSLNRIGGDSFYFSGCNPSERTVSTLSVSFSTFIEPQVTYSYSEDFGRMFSYHSLVSGSIVKNEAARTISFNNAAIKFSMSIGVNVPLQDKIILSGTLSY